MLLSMCEAYVVQLGLAGASWVAGEETRIILGSPLTPQHNVNSNPQTSVGLGLRLKKFCGVPSDTTCCFINNFLKKLKGIGTLKYIKI